MRTPTKAQRTLDATATAAHAAHGSAHGLADERTIAARVAKALRELDGPDWTVWDWAGGFYNATRALPDGRAQFIAVAEEYRAPAVWVVNTFDGDGSIEHEANLDVHTTLAEALAFAHEQAN